MSEDEKKALLAEIESARRRIATTGGELEKAAASLREKLDFPARARASYARNKPGWIGGFALAGSAAHVPPPPPRRKKAAASFGAR
jgi:hypothetical protein